MAKGIDEKIEEASTTLNDKVEANRSLIESDGDLTEDERKEFDRRAEEIDDLKDDLERFVEQKRQQEFAEARRDEPVKPDPDDAPGSGDTSDSEEDLIRSDEYRDAFETYCKHGMSHLSGTQRSVLQEGFEERAQSSGSDVSGGYTVPQAMADEIEAAQKQFGSVTNANVTTVNTEGGGDMLFPTSDDTNQKGEIVGENQDQSDQDISFGQKALGAHMYSSKFVKVSLSLLQDTGFDMDSFIGARLGERIGRIQAEHWTTGDGSNEPEGFVTGVENASATVSADSATSIDEVDLIDLKWGVDPAYQPMGEWMMHNDIVREILKITDGDNNHPFIENWRETDGMQQLLGDAVHQNQEMDNTVTDGDNTIAFGDFSKYLIRQVRGFQLRRVEERFIDKGQVAFLAFSRADGALLDAGTNPIKVLQQ